MTQSRGGGCIPLGFNSVNRLKFLLPQKPDGGTMQRHRLPSKLFNEIGEPGHTKPPAATVAPRRK